MSGGKLALGAAALLALVAAGRARLPGSRNEGEVDPLRPIGLDNMSGRLEGSSPSEAPKPEQLASIADDLKRQVNEREEDKARSLFLEPLKPFGDGWFIFDVRAPHARSPRWVRRFLPGNKISKVQEDLAASQIKQLASSMEDPTSPMYQEWFRGGLFASNVAMSGRYIGFRHSLGDVLYEMSEELNLAKRRYPITRIAIAGRKWRTGEAAKILKNLVKQINTASYMLQQHDRLRDRIKAGIRQHEDLINSDEFWEEHILASGTASPAEIEEAKAAD
jgi:hypothetical protein